MPFLSKLSFVILTFSTVAWTQTSVGPLPGDEFVGPFPSWLNVKTTYGATGDGKTDDTNAFQNALNLVGTSHTQSVLYVPAGTYRITRTLALIGRVYVSVVGENPGTTIVKWDGAPGGVMLNLNGVVDSRVDRLKFEGSGTAGVAIDQSWDGSGPNFDVHNQYADDIFQNVGIGLRCGHLGVGGADSVVVRSQFLHTTVAGISVENWNALNWLIRDSYFQDNRVSITNTLGAGNFHVYNSLFVRSSRADIEVTNAEYFSMRRNFSIGSGYFFLANPIGSAPDPITFQGNIILDPTVQAISIGSDGPVMLLDNIIRSNNGPVVSVVEGFSANPVDANVTSVGNTFTTDNQYKVAGRLLAIDDRTVDRSTINPPAPAVAATPVSQNRTVYEVAVGANAAAIQQAINVAVTQKGGQRPIVHIPTGDYPVSQSILIPSGSDVQLVGDGGSSSLSWNGPSGTLLRIASPSRATVSNLRIVGGKVAEGLYVEVKDDAGASVYLDQVNAKVTSNNLLVEGLKNANVSLHSFFHDSSQDSVKVVGPGTLTGAAPHATGRVDIFGGGDGVNDITYDVSSGGLLVAQDMWYEGSGPGFATLSDSGSFTMSGAAVYTEDPGHGGLAREIPPFMLNNFNGSVSLLNTKIGVGGISLNGSGNNTRVLGLGVTGPAGTPNYFQNNAPNAQAALLYSAVRTTGGGSRNVDDKVANVASTADFVRQMIAEVRAATPPVLSASSGPTDVRLFRVVVEQSTVGVHIRSALAGIPDGGTATSVTIASPTANQTVSGSITLAAQVTTSVAQVQYSVDGVPVGLPATTAPFNIVLDTATLTNGSHVLLATATEAGGNSHASAPVTFVVQNNGTSLGGSPLITSFVTGTARNNFSGWVGMELRVGSNPLIVSALGRAVLAGNSATHTLKLVRASDGTEVPGASIAFIVSGSPGTFSYGQLTSPVTLTANTSYYLVSSETTTGDRWYDYTPVTATSVAKVVSAAYWSGKDWISIGVDSSSYVPVNLLYADGSGGGSGSVSITSPASGATVSGSLTASANASASSGRTIARVQFTIDGNNFGSASTAAPYTAVLDTTTLANGSHTLAAIATDSAGIAVASPPLTIVVSNTVGPVSGTPLITDFVRGSTRNNFTGLVGSRITVGSASLDVAGLGRFYLAGNTATHALKLVQASDGADVPGSQITVVPSAAGQFSYTQFAIAITLQANTSYYLLSQETSGGDSWYDYTPVTATGMNVDGPVYYDGFNFVMVQAPGSSFVPVSLLYATAGSLPRGNTRPLAASQNITTTKGASVSITLTASDTETPAANLVFSITQQPSHGTLSGTAPNFSYTPASGYTGADSLMLKVTDRGAPDNCGTPNPPKCTAPLDSDPAQISIVVTPQNSTPQANAQSVQGKMGTSTAITLSGNDAETPASSLSFTVTQQPAHGTLTGSAPNVSYTPNANYAGADSFAFTVTDRGTPDNCGSPGPACAAPLTSPPATITVNVGASDVAPTATPQSVAVNFNTPKAITLAGTDAETAPSDLSFTVTANPTHGALSGTPPQLTYTPATGYSGTDSFQFTVGDRGAPDNCGTPGAFCAASATSSPATISITVAQTNTAPSANPQSVVTNQDAAKSIVLTGSDAETAAANLTFAITTNPSHGTLSGAAPNVTYTPASGYSGTDTFSFKVTDRGAPDNCGAPKQTCTAALESAPAPVTISVTPSNTVPAAGGQSAITNMNTAKSITLSGSDVETAGISLTFAITANPAHGTLSGNAPLLTYTPSSGYTGTDSFQFKVTDRGAPDNCTAGPLCGAPLDSAPATVSITISPANAAPVANGQTVSTTQNTATNILLTGKDTETAAGNLTFLVTGLPTHGTLSGNAPNLTYTPAAGYSGPDSIQFRVVDRGAPDNCGTPGVRCAAPVDSTTATIGISVTPVNTAPVTRSQTLTASMNGSTAILLNAGDGETGPASLAYTIVTPPSHGTLSGTGPGVVYTAAPGYVGPDSFQFKVTDRGSPDNCGAPAQFCAAALESAPGTITLKVAAINTFPVANAMTVSTNQNVAKVITLTGSDAESSADKLMFTHTAPSHGTLSGTAPNLTYTPNSNYVGSDSFFFTVTDRGAPDNCGEPSLACASPLGSRLATVTVVVNAANTAPVANARSLSTDKDTATGITLTGSDVETSVGNLIFAITQQPAHGSISGTPPNVTYTPIKGYTGPESFQFSVTDRGNPDNCGGPGPACAAAFESAPALVTIGVGAVNTKPVANSLIVNTTQNSAKAIALAASDAETPASSLSYVITIAPAHGTLSGSAPILTYTSAPNYVGPDSFQYKVKDRGAPDNCTPVGPSCAGSVDSDPALVSISVNGMNTVPVANPQSAGMAMNSSRTIILTGGDAETAAPNLVFTVTANPANGTLSGTAPNLMYTPNAGYTGSGSFQFKVTDRGAPDNCSSQDAVCSGALDSPPATVSVTVAASK